MPGHKRRALPFPNPYTIDITEIDGFDNLHHAEGLIREAEERAAKLYGADRSYYLVNGSTCGLLAAICAAARRGDKVLAARNCHKAVYHALSMQGLAAEVLYPAITRGDLQGRRLHRRRFCIVTAGGSIQSAWHGIWVSMRRARRRICLWREWMHAST